jgi:cytochrome c oxidase subunit 2
MWENLPLWPQRASTFATQVDALYIFLIAVTGFVSVMIFVLIFVFAIRYRRSRNPVATQIEGSLVLESLWSVVPFGIFLIMFGWGALIYMDQNQPPANAMDVFVVGKQWMWKFEHPEGVREIDQLHVPVGRDVRLTMISQDVIHSMYIPAFRVKRDVLPNRYVTEWFHATQPGRYHIFCAEYCGTLHSGMIGEVVVMNAQDYQAWLSGGAVEGSLADTGKQVFQQLGCSTCHRMDTPGIGPNLTGLFGSQVHLSDGRTVQADENYIRNSILNPGAQITAGFQPVMPTFQGMISEEQLLALVAYIRSLASAPSGGAATPQASGAGQPGGPE